jgi:hypothetical protein
VNRPLTLFENIDEGWSPSISSVKIDFYSHNRARVSRSGSTPD